MDYPEEYIDTKAKHPAEIYVEIEAGSRVIVNSLIWHGGTENKSGDRRRIMFTEYRRRDLPQFLNQQVYLSDEVKQDLDEVQRWPLSIGPDFPVDKSRHYGPGDPRGRRCEAFGRRRAALVVRDGVTAHRAPSRKPRNAVIEIQFK